MVRSAARKKPVGLRIRADYLDALKQVAARKGIPYQTLIQMWLVEKLRQEAPDLWIGSRPPCECRQAAGRFQTGPYTAKLAGCGWAAGRFETGPYTALPR